MLLVFAALGFLAWVYLAFFQGFFWKPLLDDRAPLLAFWPPVDIVVPARNEADVLPLSLPTLLQQDYTGPWRVVLVDDHSADGTTEVAKKIARDCGKEDRLIVVSAPDLPEGWKGKVAAMQTGAMQGESLYLLFTDADIAHPKDSLRRLVARSLCDKLDLNSLMVRLHCESLAEKLLIPAFVFFFAMLYPFRRANEEKNSLAAAAGGVMLVRRKALQNAGGLAAIKGALIDDCSLAAQLKKAGGDNGASGRIRLTLTDDVLSLRDYPQVRDIWNMIARTAYTQLRFSPVLLLGTLFGMTLLFLLPLPLAFLGQPVFEGVLGFATWLLMTALYIPMVRFYRLPLFWAFLLPVAALIYMGATFASAFRTWRGLGGQWKGRVHAP